MCSWKRLLLLACTASLIVNVASDYDAAVQGSVDTQTTGDTGGATGDTPYTDSSCAPICKKNEVYTDCKDSICKPYTCSELGFPLNCTSNCKPGCVCKDSFLRAGNGTCIPQDQCPSCGGDPNARSGCGTYCINCSNYKKQPVACPAICRLNGCDCKAGFIYDPNLKECVLPPVCTPTCGASEVYSPCVNGGCDARNCSQVGKPVPCVKLDPKACIKGCICKEGYLRASNGACVPKDQCEQPPTCGANEVYSPCVNGGCDARNCSQVGKPVPCVKLDPKACIKGCICKEGYLRASNGACVPKDQCEQPPMCGANEVYSPCVNGGCDARNCSQVGKPVPCVKLDPKACIKGCICKEGYLRASNGACVPKDQCVQPPTCGANEVYSPCVNGGCDARNCSQVGKPVPCVKLDPKACIKGCICKEGYLRASNGACVPKDQCEQPRCNKLNEVYDVCPAPCPPRRCDVDDRLIRCAAPPKPGDPACQPGCRCADGFARNATGTCVLRSQCEKPLQCKANEVYDSCPTICPPQKCGIDPALILCRPSPKYGDPECKPACRCIDGYVRNAANVCIPKDKCPPKCGNNEVYNSCVNGGCDARNCSQLNRPVPCIDPIKCIEGCVCANGYLRDSNGKCVPKDQCGSVPKCGNNEVYSSCVNGGCGARNCSQLNQSTPCIDPIKCFEGCVCVNGYLRDSDGKCVPKDQCGSGPKKSTSTTPAPPTTTPPSDVCTGQNEFFDTCIKGCSNQTCDSIGKIYHCPIQTTVCKTGCRCKPGFYRNSNNVCVEESQCPHQCGENAYWVQCYVGCSNQTCNEIGKRYSCPTIFGCQSLCRCKDGFWRDKNNKCIAERQCPTPPCPEGETYNRCPTVKCDGDYCPKTRDSPQTCPVGIVCDPPRCTCGFNQKRDWKTGKCIAISDCPPFACNGPNEEYQSCPAGCPGENCTDYINGLKCPPFKIGIVVPCRPQCKCKAGYFRNSDGVCIIASKCGPKKTNTTTTTTPAPSKLCPGQNEFFDTCIQGCSNQTCDSIGKIYNCPIQTTVCKTGCRCKPGFYRNSDNVCVEESQCPQQCGENAYYEKCYQGCSNQTCNEIGAIYACPAIFGCKSLCRCNPGFWRDKDNKCIAESQCPTPPCPEGETYNRCPTVKCDGDYCPKTRDCPQTCPVGIVCDPPRCTCGFNQKRDWKTGKCIPTRDCPPFACNGPNEEYQPCPAFCPGDNCTDYINDTKCPPGRIGIVLTCRPQCKCKTGYFRNTDGVCIIGSKCGPKKWTTTTTTTPVDNCDQSTPAVTTPKPTSGDSGSIVASLQAGVTTFTGKFLYDRINASPGENIIISAYSVFTPLSQLALYATGVTLSQLLTVLNVKNKDDIRTGFPALAASYDGQTSVNFSVAAEVLSNINYKLSDAFIKDSLDIFKADAKSVDFADNVKAAADINAWVESKTNNRIQNLVSADMFGALTRLVLVNAIYFKGTWKYQFDTKNTNDADFYLSDGSTKKTKLMYQKGSFRYGEVADLDCKVIELPYVGMNFTMFVVLPNKYDGLLGTANKLRDSATFNKAYESMYSQTVEVYLPPFEITTTTNLADILKKQNVVQMFNPTDSGLSGMLEKPEEVYVSAAVQKAFIKCDETGSEAAAANAVIVGATSVFNPKQLVFKADHGFLYYVLYKNTAVFCGSLSHPN